jgi:hypothetical protein
MIVEVEKQPASTDAARSKKDKDLNFLTYVEKLDDTVENYWLSVRTRLT